MGLLNLSGFPEVKYGERSGQELYKEDLSVLDWLSLTIVFKAYAPFKGWLNATRKKHGMTSFDGWEFYD